MKKSLLFTCILCISTILIAQYETPDEYYYKFFNQKKTSLLKYDEIQGTPYLDEEFKPGKIVLSDGKEIQFRKLRYDWYSCEIESKKGDDIYILPLDKKIVFILIDSIKHIPFYINNKNAYAIELKSSNTKLHVTYPIKFNKPTAAMNGYENSKPAHFKWLNPNYFVYFNSNLIIKLDISKKKISESFPSEVKNDLDNYIKQKKLRFKNENEIIELIEFYDEIDKKRKKNFQ